MAADLIYAFRITRLPLLDAGGANIGRLDDIVIVPGRAGSAPRVVGFTATSQRRRIFVNAGRISELGIDGARLRSWDIDLNPFKIKKGERLLGRDVIGRADDDRMYAFKKGSGLVVGIGDGFTCVSSDLPSLLPLESSESFSAELTPLLPDLAERQGPWAASLEWFQRHLR